jgi:serine/threonine-protein kinase
MIGNRFQITQLIGTGGMSIVYKAWDSILDRDVAIKVLRQKYAQTEDVRLRFQQEAKAAARLSHPNIVTVYDSGIDGPRIYIALQYIKGSTLKLHIQSREKINLINELDYAIQICKAVDHAHTNRIIHCDLKPSNILINESNQIKITDFGLARVMQQNIQEQESYFWGSPFYISPEQTQGESPTIASDIYSLGVVLYQMMTGQLPIMGDSVPELLNNHINAQPIPPREINNNIPISLNDAILRCLQKDPKKRYRMVSQVRDVLANIRHSIILNATTNSLPRTSINVDTAKTPSEKSHPELPVSDLKSQLSQFDWKTILLGLLATIAAAGLIPFWIYVYFNVPGR